MNFVAHDARQNFSLRADGVLVVVCPVTDETGLADIGIFGAAPEETEWIMVRPSPRSWRGSEGPESFRRPASVMRP